MTSSKDEAVKEACDIFVEMYNRLYSERKDVPISRNDIDFHHLKSFDGRCGHNGHSIYFGIHVPRWMKIWSVEKKTTLLLHELSHIEETSHRPSFYDKYIELFKRGDKEFYEEVFGEDIDMGKIKKKISMNPKTNQVDHRMDNVANRRKEVHEELGVDYCFNDLFTNIYTTRYSKWRSSNRPVRGSKSTEKISIEDIETSEMMSKKNCVEKLHNIKGVISRENYRIKPLPLTLENEPKDEFEELARLVKRLHKEGVISNDEIHCKKV